MSKPKIKWNIPAFEEVRRLPKVKAELESRAESIAAQAGEGYEMRSGEGKTRSRASVVTTTADSMRDNRKNNTLLKSIDAGKRK